MNPLKSQILKKTTQSGGLPVKTFEGDCNKVLLQDVFPEVTYESYRRALCLLDPYGLQLSWEVIERAGKMKSIELFINFPVMDINRNVLRRDRSRVTEEQKARLDFFWGDRSWSRVCYREDENDLFASEVKVHNDELAEAFRKRLIEKAGFKHVPKPLAMKNSTKAIVYYLFFAAQLVVAENIADSIMESARERYGW